MHERQTPAVHVLWKSVNLKVKTTPFLNIRDCFWEKWGGQVTARGNGAQGIINGRKQPSAAHKVAVLVVGFYLGQVKAEAEKTALAADFSYQSLASLPLHECHRPSWREREERTPCEL